MSVKTATNRFILSSLRTGFYQQLLKSGFQELGYSLVRGIETAQICRQGDRVVELASILDNFPTKEHQLIGQYYKAWLGQKTGQDARPIFERVAEQSLIYKTRALISLAASEARRGNFDEGLRYYKEASKTANNPSLIVEISRDIAMVRSNQGDSKQAIKEFERILPLAKHANSFYYYQFLNSYAVELAEVGRLEEARNISDIVLASPYAFAYPEWRKTREDIERKAYRLSRSAVSFAQKPVLQNVVYLPERDRQEYSPNPFQSQGIVVKLNTWKSKMVKEPNGNDELDFSKMSDKEKLFKIIELSSNEDITDDQLDRILEAVIRITSKRS